MEGVRDREGGGSLLVPGPGATLRTARVVSNGGVVKQHRSGSVPETRRLGSSIGPGCPISSPAAPASPSNHPTKAVAGGRMPQTASRSTPAVHHHASLWETISLHETVLLALCRGVYAQ